MSEITPERVREALADVADPTLLRPIAKTGQLREVSVDGSTIRLDVALISPGYPRRDELADAIEAALAPLGDDLSVDITWSLAVPRKPARQDLDRLPTVKNVIAIAAGKGGVGKSTVAVNVASALHAMGAKVGVLDADIYGPSVPHMLGTPERHADKNTDGDRILPALHRGMPVMSVDFFVESGRAVIWRGPMIHKLLQQFLEDVDWGELDYLIVDLPPGTGDAQLSLGQLIPITAGLIVTTPQEVALIDVRKAVDMFEKLEVPVVGVIENMSHYQCPSCGHHDRIFASGGGKRLAEELDVELLGQLPIHPSISMGGERGAPVVVTAPDSPHAETLFKTAAAVALAASKRSGTGPKRSRMLRTV
jgi:ATP-binding protein involved in chromosome partitioning